MQDPTAHDVPMTTAETPMPSAVALHDARSFFEKALQFGLQHGILTRERLEALNTEAPKGMVQIARYFGSEFLRPQLELARERLVNLVSLYLQHSCEGDLHRAAVSLRDHSLLSRSKGGSDLLKALIVMPASSHFGMIERGGFADRHIPQLADWSLRPYTDYQAEFARRSRAAATIEAAIWLAEALGLDADELHDAACDADAVIRTALLVHAAGGREMPDWVALEKLLAALRRKPLKAPAGKAGGTGAATQIPLPKALPAPLRPVVEPLRQSVLADWPRLLDAKVAPRKLFGSMAFTGRYFWIEDALSEVDHHDQLASKAWNRLTGGHRDDGSLLTVLLCVAAGSPPKTLLTEAAAKTLIRRIRKSGIAPDLASAWLDEHAPVHDRDDLAALWQAFIDDALATLTSDRDTLLKEALALLRRECNVG